MDFTPAGGLMGRSCSKKILDLTSRRAFQYMLVCLGWFHYQPVQGQGYTKDDFLTLPDGPLGPPRPIGGSASQAWVAGLWMFSSSLHPWMVPTRPKVPHTLLGLG